MPEINKRETYILMGVQDHSPGRMAVFRGVLPNLGLIDIFFYFFIARSCPVNCGITDIVPGLYPLNISVS